MAVNRSWANPNHGAVNEDPDNPTSTSTQSPLTQRELQRSAAWKKVRKQILERDGHTCQIGGPNCTHAATQVDHIYPLSLGGEPFNPDNLRAACELCNKSRARSKHSWVGDHTAITVYRGSATTQQKTEAAREDGHPLVISTSALAEALAPSPDTAHLTKPLASYLWQIAVQEIEQGNSGGYTTVAVVENPDPNIPPPRAHAHRVVNDGDSEEKPDLPHPSAQAPASLELKQNLGLQNKRARKQRLGGGG